MTYLVDSGGFQGPMDLLVDLIRKREMDIYDIEIHVLVEDFLEHVREMESLDMDLTADFISMASYLLQIKSQMLVPKYVVENEEIVEEDPRDELVSRILEYERMKQISQELKRLEEYESRALYRQQEDFSHFSGKELLKNLDLKDLYGAFHKALDRYDRLEEAMEELGRIPAQDFTLEEAQVRIYDFFQKEEEVLFSKILEGSRNRGELIVYFLAILELAKSGFLMASQEKKFSEVSLKRREG